jgi:hypothetical protein
MLKKTRVNEIKCKHNRPNGDCRKPARLRYTKAVPAFERAGYWLPEKRCLFGAKNSKKPVLFCGQAVSRQPPPENEAGQYTFINLTINNANVNQRAGCFLAESSEKMRADTQNTREFEFFASYTPRPVTGLLRFSARLAGANCTVQRTQVDPAQKGWFPELAATMRRKKSQSCLRGPHRALVAYDLGRVAAGRYPPVERARANLVSHVQKAKKLQLCAVSINMSD